MSSQEPSGFFDLYAEGIGYLNRVRRVRPQEGEPFWACTVCALRGAAGKAEYTWFDCRASGKQAQEALRLIEPYVLREDKVLIGFRLSDLRAEAFVFKDGKHQGQPGVNLRARLLSVKFAKVAGTEVLSPDQRPARAHRAA